MGKIDDNKQHKLEALLENAYELFLTQGIEQTSISDIVKKAGVAKGTFYLYFKDKYDIQNQLIARTADRLFVKAYQAMENAHIPTFEDRIIFIVDYILDYMQKNKPVLRFISKNLSWGVFRRAMTSGLSEEEMSSYYIYQKLLSDEEYTHLRAPKIMFFLIVELASATSFSTILENDPMPFEKLKPYLNDSIRAIIRSHTI
jgi:AcrR family transcriptional regulator